MDADDSRLVAGVVEWLFNEVLQDVRCKPTDQRSLLIRLAVCGRGDGRDVVVDGMLR